MRTRRWSQGVALGPFGSRPWTNGRRSGRQSGRCIQMPERLRADPNVVRLAADLELRASADPTAAILRMCRKKIEGLLVDFPCATLTQLLETACAYLDTIFIEIHDDMELRAVEQKYLARGEHAFVGLAKQ